MVEEHVLITYKSENKNMLVYDFPTSGRYYKYQKDDKMKLQ